MRKLVLLSMLFVFCMMSAVVMARPYASQITLSDNEFIYTTTTAITISFMLNEPADSVDVQIIGAAPDTYIHRTLTITNAPRGLNSVVWDGLNVNGNEVGNGIFSVKIICNKAEYPAWTNITPVSYNLVREWVQETSVLPGVAVRNGNEIRGVGFKDGKLIFSGTNPIRFWTLNPADGVPEIQIALGNLSDPYAIGFGALTYNAWLGPYDLSSLPDGTTYVGHYRGATFPIARIDDITTSVVPPAGVSPGTGFNNRTLDATKNTTTTIFAGDAGTVVLGQVSIWRDSPAGSAFTKIATLPAPPAGPNASHMLVAKDGQDLVAGCVIWTSSNAGSIERWVYDGAAWAKDAAFVVDLKRDPANNTSCGGDYASIGGKDVLVVVTNGNPQAIIGLDGATGAILFEYLAPEARPYSSGNGDIHIVPATANRGAIYYAMPDKGQYGKINYNYGEIGSGQYYTPNGVAIITDPEDINFGKIAVASGFPDLSANPGATANKQGLYILNPDMTFPGGTEQTSFDAAINDPAAPWVASDTWSPWKVRKGRDDNKFYLGDWGTFNTSDNIYRYDLASTATAILKVGAGNHGRVLSCMSFTSGTATYLLGLDRDYDAAAYPKLFMWPVNDTVENFTGVPTRVLNSASTGLGFSAYTMADFVIDSNNVVYVCNARYGGTENILFAFNLEPLPVSAANVKWTKTYNGLGLNEGAYPRSMDIDEAAGRLYVYYRNTTGGAKVIAHDIATGNIVDQFVVGTASATSTVRQGTAVDYAGNIMTCNNSDEHVRMWAPPGPNAAEVFAVDSIEVSNSLSDVRDWFLY